MFQLYKNYLNQKQIKKANRYIHEYLKSPNKDSISKLITQLKKIKKKPRNEALFFFLRAADDFTHIRVSEIFSYFSNDANSYLLNILKTNQSNPTSSKSKNIMIRSKFGAAASCLGKNKIKESIPFLLKAINNSSFPISTKIIAIKALGEIKNKKSLDSLHKLLKSSSISILKIVSKVLGQLGYISSLNPIFIELRKSEELRGFATQSISLMDSNLVIPIVSKILRYSSLKIAPEIISQKSAFPLDENARILSANILGEFQTQTKASSHLILSYHQKDTIKVKSAIIRAMGISNDPKVLSILITIIKTEVNLIQESAIKALGDLGLKKSLNDLRKVLILNEDKIELQIVICKTYAQIGSKTSLPFIRECLLTNKPSLCITAIYSISQVKNIFIEDIRMLASLCNAANWTIRSLSSKALINLSEKHHIEELHNLLEDTSINLRLTVFEALSNIGGIESIYIILEAILFDGLSMRAATRSLFVISKKINDNKLKKITGYIGSENLPNRYHPEVLRYFYEYNDKKEMPFLHFIAMLHFYEADPFIIENCFNRIEKCDNTANKLRLLTPKGFNHLFKNHLKFLVKLLNQSFNDLNESHRIIELYFPAFFNDRSIYPNPLEWLKLVSNLKSLEIIFSERFSMVSDISVTHFIFNDLWLRLSSHINIQIILEEFQKVPLFNDLLKEHPSFITNEIQINLKHLDYSKFNHPALIFNWYLITKSKFIDSSDYCFILSHINQLNIWYPNNHFALYLISSSFFNLFIESNSEKDIDRFINSKPNDFIQSIQKIPGFFYHIQSYKVSHRIVIQEMYLNSLSKIKVLIGKVALKYNLWKPNRIKNSVSKKEIIKSDLAQSDIQIKNLLK